jgi:ribosomal protein S8
MNTLVNRINTGYISNIDKVKIPFKTKYLPILDKLTRLNLIGNYKVDTYSITIFLRYYNNKPLIFLETVSLQSYKQYKKIKRINKKSTKDTDLNIFSTNIGILVNEEMQLFNIGGKSLFKVHYYYKNIIY